MTLRRLIPLALMAGMAATVAAAGPAVASTAPIQLTFPALNIQPGDSGGALANSASQVIGVDTAASASYHLNRRGGSGGGQAVTGFAIPINQAMSIAHQIETGSGSSTVHIGQSAVVGVSVTDPGASGGGGSGQGAAVSQVLSGGPAPRPALPRAT